MLVHAYGRTLSVPMDGKILVGCVKARVAKEFPVKVNKIRLYYGNVEMTDNIKEVVAYGVNYKDNNLYVRAPRLYVSDTFVSAMKTNGSWSLDKEAINDLELTKEFDAILKVVKD